MKATPKQIGRRWSYETLSRSLKKVEQLSVLGPHQSSMYYACCNTFIVPNYCSTNSGKWWSGIHKVLCKNVLAALGNAHLNSTGSNCTIGCMLAVITHSHSELEFMNWTRMLNRIWLDMYLASHMLPIQSILTMTPPGCLCQIQNIFLKFSKKKKRSKLLIAEEFIVFYPWVTDL